MPLLFRMTRTPSMGSTKNKRRPSAVIGDFLGGMLDELPRGAASSKLELGSSADEECASSSSKTNQLKLILIFYIQFLAPKIMIFLN